MPKLTYAIKEYSLILQKILPLLSFLIPFIVLYFYQSTVIHYYDFEKTWKGRTYYIFFLWIAALEMIWNWEKLQNKTKLKSVRAVALTLALLLPTVYIVSANYYGFPSKAIVDWAWQNDISGSRTGGNRPPNECDWMPLSIEYLVLAMLFTLIVWLQYGTNGLKNLSISPVFMALIGAIYLIDNFYKNAQFAPFQIFVPTTATLAENILKIMGYQTDMVFTNDPGIGPAPLLKVSSAGKSAQAYIAWPCSGVDSLIIYFATSFLFIKNSGVTSWKKGMVYFTIGAVVTYLINILRIVTIFIIGIIYGDKSPEFNQFHNYYGALYAIAWIIMYPLTIMGIQALWRYISKPKTATRSFTQ